MLCSDVFLLVTGSISFGDGATGIFIDSPCTLDLSLFWRVWRRELSDISNFDKLNLFVVMHKKGNAFIMANTFILITLCPLQEIDTTSSLFDWSVGITSASNFVNKKHDTVFDKPWERFPKIYIRDHLYASGLMFNSFKCNSCS